MLVILFEDALVRQLYPITIGRAAFEISCGSCRLIELVERLGLPIRAAVRPHLRGVVEDDQRGTGSGDSDDGPILLVNARLVPSVHVLRHLEDLVGSACPSIIRSPSGVAAALLSSESPRPPRDAFGEQWNQFFADLPLGAETIDLPLFEYPHDLIRHHVDILQANLEDRLRTGDYDEVQPGVFVKPGAKLGQYCVCETDEGPIVLEENVRIGPYCYLSGPVHLAAAARVIEHAAIKDFVALGHTTKVGGEVERSIVEPYTNKQHHGFLGHSYLGSWVNLGAGTSNSDLKNTYGSVAMEYNGGRVNTNMQFIGCVVGDYAKTAVNTSIFTGKTIGACTMVYGFVTTNVPSFVNYARSFGQVTEAPVDVMIATQRRMFARRSVAQRPCDIDLLYAMYDLTRHERQLATQPLSL